MVRSPGAVTVIGSRLTYDRKGSLESGGVILDEYYVVAGGVDTTLFIDEYNYSDPQAPLGFTCSGAFPLSAPSP